MIDYLEKDIQLMFQNNEYTKIINLANKRLDQNQNLSITEIKNNHFVLAKAYYFLTKNKQALEHITEVLKILDNHKFPQNEIIDTKIEYAKILRRMAKNEQAIEIYSEILEQFRNSLSDQNKPVIYHNLANLQLEQGNFEQSKELFLIVLEFDQKNQNEKGQAHTLSSLGGLYFYLGEYDKAIDFYLQSLNLRRKLKDALGEATVSLNLGSVYANQLEQSLASEFLDNAERLFLKIDHERGVQSVLNTKARLNFSLGKYENVIANLERFTEKTEGDISKTDISLILILAESLCKEKHAQKARSVIELGLKGVHHLTEGKYEEMVQEYGKLKQMLSQVAVLQNNFDEALEILEELEGIGKQIKDEQSFIAIYHAKSYIHLTLGNYEQALVFAEKGKDLADKFKDSSIVELLDLLFEIYFSLGDFQKCIRNLKNISKYAQISNEMKYMLIVRTFNLIEKIKLKGIKDEFSVLLKLSEHEKSIYVQQETLDNLLHLSSNEKKLEILQQMGKRIQKDTQIINSEEETDPTLERKLEDLINDKRKLKTLPITELLVLLDSVFFSIKYNLISEEYLQDIDMTLMLPEESKPIVRLKQLVLKELLQYHFKLENLVEENNPLEQKFKLMFAKFYNELSVFQDGISKKEKVILLYLVSNIIIDTLFVLYFSDKNET